MKKRCNSRLTALMCSLILGAFNSTAFAADMPADNVEEYTIEGVVVEGDSTGKTNMPGGFQNNEARLGILGEKDVMKIPMTIHSISEKTLEQQMGPNGTLQDVMSNVPGITVGTSPIKTDFSIRGMAGNAALMTYNNVPGFFVMAIGPEDYTIGSMDVVIGPAATLIGSHQSSSGSYSAADSGTPGSINLLTKRALKDDHIKYTQTVSGYGNYGEAFDVSQRFGKNREWGVRVYGQKNEGGLAISGAGINRKNISVDISRETEKANTNLFFTSFDKKHHGTDRRFTLNRGFAKYPKAPNNDTNYETSGMYQQTYGWITTLNHIQKMDENSSWFINAGRGNTYLRRFIFDGDMNINDKGELTKDTTAWSQHFAVENTYFQAGIKDKVKLGKTIHNLTASVDRSYRTWYNNNQDFNVNKKKGTMANKYKIGFGGNIYDGLIAKGPVDMLNQSRSLGKRFSNRELDVSLNLVDDIEIGKWDIMIAGTRRHGNFLSKAGPTQAVNGNVHDSNWTPTYGISYAPTEDLTLYAARAYAISRGSIVDGNYDNNGEYLPPVKTKNDEIGIKLKHKNIFYSLSFFDLTQPNYFEFDTGKVDENAKKLYHREINGKSNYKGVDFSLTGKLAEKWNLFGGFEYLNAKQKGAGTSDGNPVDGSVRWHGVLGLEYKPTANTSITGRFNYSDSAQYVCDSGVRKLPAWKTFDLFASQKTHIGSAPVTFRAQVFNLFDSDHWIGKTGEGTKFLLSSPRTFMVSAEFELDKLWKKHK